MTGTGARTKVEMEMDQVLRKEEHARREVRDIEAGLEGISQKDRNAKCKKIYSEFEVKNAWNNDRHLLPLSILIHLLSEYEWEEGEKTKKERKCIKRCIESMIKFMFERNVTMVEYQKKTNDILQLLDDFGMVNLIDITCASHRSELRYKMEYAMNAIKNCKHDIYSFITAFTKWKIVREEIRKKTSYAREVLIKLEQLHV